MAGDGNIKGLCLALLCCLVINVSMCSDLNSGTCDANQLDCMDQRGSILILNDEWGTSKGGISSLNQQVAYQAKEAGFEVYVTVLKADEDDIDDAEEHGINLIIAETIGNTEPDIDWLEVYHKVHFPNLEEISDLKVIIGHVPLTSRAALEIRKNRFSDSRVFLFIHVIPEDIEVHKENWTPEKVEERESNILSESEGADAVFSVGPRIYSHFDSKFRAMSKGVKHIEYIPRPQDDFFDINITRPKDTHPIQILTFGRVAGVANLKGYDIVASALSRVTDLYHTMRLPPPKWIVRGVAKGLHDESNEYIRNRLKSNHGKYLKINLYPYGTQDKIRRDLKQSHLVLMASRSEPFGLVGLEAIAAGIPVLVTVNSGLAQFIKREFPVEANQMIVDVGVNDVDIDNDIDTWRDRVIDVLRYDYDVRFDVAQKIKNELYNCKTIDMSKKIFQDLLKAKITT
ncbi:uncharacterized protein [Ptychodera flava]|uniref:uncharacterized protein n=1 Tax=Ptychodera flava TaxID=63121 RepID=UPI00396A3050